jgi:hypothetical protein
VNLKRTLKLQNQPKAVDKLSLVLMVNMLLKLLMVLSIWY